MNRAPFSEDEVSFENGVGSSVPSPGGATNVRSNALSNKVTSILSSSYADPEIRTALDLLDVRGTQNDAETRRNLRLDAQKQVIECNVQIVEDFGKVAEVGPERILEGPLFTIIPATSTARHNVGNTQQNVRRDAATYYSCEAGFSTSSRGGSRSDGQQA